MLSERYKVIAEAELREDENRKQQALQQLNDWFAKHPFIKNVRQDDVFLLRFLRTKKYQMDEIFRMLENFYVMLKKYENWFRVSDKQHDRMMQLYWSGYIYPFAERDQHGRSILIYRFQKIDSDNFIFRDSIRLVFHIASTLLEEEETQICGFTLIFDYTNATLKQISSVPLKELVEFFNAAGHAPGRNKQIVFINLPSFAAMLIEVVKKSIKEKLRNRIVLAKSIKEVVKPSSILPKEFGGELSEHEHLSRFMVKYNERHSQLDGIFQHPKVNLEAQRKIGNETVGSFRKLDID